MVSFISTLSFLLLVLANGYFSIPVVNQFVSTTPFSVLFNNLTTDQTVSLPLASNDQTTGTPMIGSKQPIAEANTAGASRISAQMFTSAPTTFTIERSSTYPSDLSGSSSTTAKSLNQVTQQTSSSAESKEDTGATPKPSFESTTNAVSSFPSTSSAVAPKLVTPQSFIVTTTLVDIPEINIPETSTEKYTGLLTDDEGRVIKSKYQSPKRPLKTLRKPKFQAQDTSNEVGNVQPAQKSTFPTNDGTKDSSIPIAFLDQQPLSNIPSLLNGVMVLDESNSAVNGVPKTSSKINTTDKKERKALNQGEKSSQSEEEKSNN